MQPRFTPPVGVPPSGFPLNAMPMPPRPGFPGGFQPMFAGAPPPPHMMAQHGMPMGMMPGMNMGMGPGPPMPMHPGGGPPPQMFNSMPGPGGSGFGSMQPPPQSYPPKPAPSVIVGAPVLRAGTVATSAPLAPAGGPPVPTQPAPIVVVSAASAMHDFNFSNPAAVFMNATSNLLNKSIFLNSAAALPLTLFIGQVPMDMADAVVTKILEACGKIFKLVRPVDPASQLPASFVLVTYSQGICAARCANILNNYLIDPVECTAFVVKTGKKDGAALESIVQSEKEAGEQLPEGYSLQDDIYTPIRVTIDNILVTANPPPPPSVPPPAEVVAAAAAEHSSKSNIVIPQGAIVLPTITLAMVNSRNEAIEAGEIVEDEELPVSGAAGTAAGRESNAGGMVVNYYNHLDVVDNAVSNTIGGGSTLLGTSSVAEQMAVDEAGEKMLTGEIQKFRQRQLQRDKDVEEERKLKIKQKMQELRELQKIRAEREARVQAEGPPLPPTAPPASNNNFRSNAAAADAALDSTGGTKRRLDTMEESAEVLEAKRRRKLQVLEMLAGDSGLLEQVLTATETPSSAADADAQLDTVQPASSAGAAEAPGRAPATSTSTAAGASAAVKKLVSMRSKAAVSSKASFAAADEEESAPKREMVLLDYSADELRELAHTAQHYNISHAQDEGNLEDDLAAYRKKGALGAFGAGGAGAGANMTAAGGIDISSIQARVLAQAQAISAALAQKTQAAAAPAVTTAAFTAGPSTGAVGTSSSAGSAAQKGAAVVDEKARLKSLVDKIPTDKDELFAYPVNWTVLDKHDILNEVMTAWITKKIVEYLGEEEEQLRDFIVNKLRARCRPAELLEELAMVLDEDAALPFVLKLWRMLVYYSVKNQ